MKHPSVALYALVLTALAVGPATAGARNPAHDAGQRLTSLTNPNSESTAWTYLNNDRLESQSLHNTVTTTWTLNALGQPTALHTRKGTGAMDPLLASYTSMAYDGAGNRTGFTATVTGASSLSGTVGYTLDSKDQLTQETSTRNSNYTHNFAYDSAGNPTTFKGSSATFNSNNQRTSDTHDNNGNPTTYKGTSCSYDVENRLTAYGSALTCGYRGDGLRAWKQPGGGSKTYFLYDGTDVVCELDSSGNLVAHSTHGAAGLVSRRVSSTTTYYAFDAHGSVSVTTDSSGDAVTSHGWDAYGTSIGSAPSGPYGYGAQWGYYTDSETGLCALAFRAYDPATGRFLTRDPIGYAGGVNLYGYVGNGPGSGVDPLGWAQDSVTSSFWAAVKAGDLEGAVTILESASNPAIAAKLRAAFLALPAVQRGINEAIKGLPRVNYKTLADCGKYAEKVREVLGQYQPDLTVWTMRGGQGAPYVGLRDGRYFTHHTFIEWGDRIIDTLTGPNGMPKSQWEVLWHNGDAFLKNYALTKHD